MDFSSLERRLESTCLYFVYVTLANKKTDLNIKSIFKMPNIFIETLKITFLYVMTSLAA